MRVHGTGIEALGWLTMEGFWLSRKTLAHGLPEAECTQAFRDHFHGDP